MKAKEILASITNIKRTEKNKYFNNIIERLQLLEKHENGDTTA